ncbi:MAG: hypothetical protein A3F68_13425 [Acidobacteria bacterium RIFCSPLOWO2_12_FULL_54_10]|nr:MAG: hypothetical protein A3F68_13425 [Acidobacteria bacterium RIFCSPLOWO2_12_FULL_54_10]
MPRSDLHLRGKTAREFTIGRRLRELREQRHLTQQEMAERAGVPRTYISRIENARLLPGPVMLHRIADALKVEMLDMLPHSQGSGHAMEGIDDGYWSELTQHFSVLRADQMNRVLSSVRQMAGESVSPGYEVRAAVG